MVASLAQSNSASALEGQHSVVSGDTLSGIAEQHQTTWDQVWAQNPQIADPNMIFVGDLVTTKAVAPVAPAPTQEPVATPPAPVCNEATQWVRADNGQCLDKPQEQQVPVVAPSASAAPAPVEAPVVAQRSSGEPNAYAYGYCTWHVKNLRPDIGGYWGNANQWVGSAQAAGYSTGSTPAVGAIGVSYTYYLGHVAYVTAVHGDGTITVSEMNYQGHGVQSYRVTSASEFTYIY